MVSLIHGSKKPATFTMDISSPDDFMTLPKGNHVPFGKDIWYQNTVSD